MSILLSFLAIFLALFAFTYRIVATKVPFWVNLLGKLVGTMWEQIIGWSFIFWLALAFVIFVLFAIELLKPRKPSEGDIEQQLETKILEREERWHRWQLETLSLVIDKLGGKYATEESETDKEKTNKAKGKKKGGKA